MVTRVEVGSIASLRAGPGLGDISREEALKRTYFCQTGDASGAPSTRILRAKSPLRTHLFPLPLAPKPFLKEQVSEKKAPVTSSWPGATQSCPSTEADKKEAKADLAKRMPSLAGQEADRGETVPNGPSVPNKATFLRPGPSTMGIFETTKAGPSLGKGTSEGSRDTSSRAAQASPLSARPEVATKPALPSRKPPVTLSRPTSLSQDAGSTVSQEEAGPAQPLPKAHSVEDPAGQAPEAKPHLKRRPMSAVFIDYLQPPKPGPGGVAVTGKVPPTPPEKTWVRKPRPLSVDLTAVFENREMLLRKVGGEQSAAERQGPERTRTSMEPKGDAEGPARMDITPQDPDADFQEVAKKLHARREKTIVKQADTDSPRTPRARAIPGNDQSPQEEERPDQQSEKVPESPLPRPGRGLGLAEVKAGGSDQEAPAGTERKSVGSIRKRLSLFEEESAVALAVVSEPSPVAPESPSTGPEPERAGVSVQARVKGWTMESAGAKPEVRRRASQARPLSMDLTKPFSRSPSSSEVGYEKCALLGGEHPGERREKPTEGRGLDGAPATKSPWKPGVPQKSRQTEPKDASDQDPDRCRRAHSTGDPGPSEVSPEDEGSFQKVWATVFEHHVERHTVVDQAGHCLSPASSHDVVDIPDPKPRPEKGYWLGKDPPGVINKRDSSRRSDHADPGMLGRAVLVDVEPRQYPTSVPETPHPMGEGHSSRSVLRHLEGPPVSQRVQPKYDIVHASGERAHSEAVSRVPEEKAVTLRSGRPRLSLQGRQLSQEVNPAHVECALQAPGGAVQRASSVWEARGQEASGPKLDSQQPRDGLGSSCPSSTWTGGVVTSWLSTSVACKGLSAPQRGPSWDGSSHPPSRATVEPGDPQVQARPNSLSLQNDPLTVGSEDNPRLAQAFQPEVRMRRSNPSEPRMDRWRRRTLPHDVKFDAFSLLTPESTSRSQQRPADDVTSPTCALKRPPLSHLQAQTREVTPGASHSRTSPGEKPGPSAEPSATFFAVTYQIPDIQKAKSIVKPGPENVSEPSRRTAPPLSPRSFVSTLASPSHEEPRAPPSSKGWTKGREYEEVKSLSKHPKATDQPSSAEDRMLEPSRDRVVDVDALWIHRGSEDGTLKDSRTRGASSGMDAPQTSPVLRRPKSLLVRRRTEVISETFPGKMRDGYRSGVLDIDALMAEYKEQPNRVPSKAQEQRDSPAEPSGSPQERSGWPKEAEWGRRSLKEAPRLDSVGKQAGTSVRTPQPPGPSKQPAEPLGAAMTTKSGLPLWAPPHSAPVDNCPNPSPVSAGSRRKSSGITEFESKPSSSEHQEAKYRQGPAKSQEPGIGDRISPRSPPSDRKKGTPKRSTGQGVEGNGVQWGTPPRDCTWSPLDIKRACSEKGPPARVREGLSVMQDARQRRREQLREKPSLPTQTPKATAGPCQKEARKPDGPKVPLQNPEQGEGLQDSQQPLRKVSPVASVPRRSHSFCKDKRSGPFVAGLMDYLGDKLSVAQTHMTQWVGTVRRSFQEALHVVTATVGTDRSGETASRTPFKRTSSFRHLASRSRESFRRFSARSQQRFSSLRKRQPDSEAPDLNQLKQCFSRRAPEAKDTDTLVHDEADSQYGTWADQGQNGGSFGPESPSSPDSSAASAGKQQPGSHLSSYTESTSVDQHDSSRERRSSSVDRSSSELESTEGPEGPPPSDACPAEREDDFSFIHQTSVLDSSALKTRVQLSKRSRRRAPISHSLRRSQFSESESRSPLEEGSQSLWMFKDSTEEKSPKRDESDEEPPKVERTPVSHPQRMPVFPGMDPAVLKAQLHKRPEVDSPGESLSWAPQPKTLKSPFQPGVLGSRVLPSSTDRDERSEEASPQWLKELKSKKRQSLYDNQA